MLRPDYPRIILAALMLFLLTGIDIILPDVFLNVVDVVITAGRTPFFVPASGILIGLGVMKAVIGFGNRYTAQWLAHSIAYDLRNQLYDHIQRLSFSFHDHAQSGQLISRCIEDVRSLQNFTGNGIIELSRVILLM